ncbi:hypothetical protein HMPREF9120_01278 [Neisseria sp. oral taxon 020 str. F0370]|nr:hypothetical protein HMPREF9120_01278 [Neisseria sp. oral taxon 020 str. F0370]
MADVAADGIAAALVALADAAALPLDAVDVALGRQVARVAAAAVVTVVVAVLAVVGRSGRGVAVDNGGARRGVDGDGFVDNGAVFDGQVDGGVAAVGGFAVHAGAGQERQQQNRGTDGFHVLLLSRFWLRFR